MAMMRMPASLHGEVRRQKAVRLGRKLTLPAGKGAEMPAGQERTALVQQKKPRNKVPL